MMFSVNIYHEDIETTYALFQSLFDVQTSKIHHQDDIEITLDNGVVINLLRSSHELKQVYPPITFLLSEQNLIEQMIQKLSLFRHQRSIEESSLYFDHNVLTFKNHTIFKLQINKNETP